MKYDTAFQFLDSLVVKGTEKSFFINCSAFQPLKKERKWQIFLSNFEKNHQLFQSKKNTQLERLLKGGEYSDQEFRAKSGSYDVYGDTIQKIDKNNVKILKYIIDKYGFPNENLIGRENPMEDDIPSFIVFLHQCQKMSKNKEDYDFTSIQIEAVKKGELDPHYLAEWLSKQAKPENDLGGWGICQISTNRKKSPLVVDKTTQKQKNDINKRRLTLGLETLEEFNRKAVFTIKEKDKAKIFAFKRYSHLNLFELANPKDFDKILETMEPIE